MFAVRGACHCLAIVTDRPAADGKDQIYRFFFGKCRTLHDLLDGGIGHDARQFNRLFAYFAQLCQHRIVNAVLADRPAAVHQHYFFSVLAQFFTQILQ